MRNKILVLMILLMTATFFPVKAHAFDPITMAVLAPVALKAAEVAKPYVIRSMASTAHGLFKVGKDVFHIFYLPWGLGEITFGAPFHKFRSGMVHIVKGGIIAPTRLILHTLLLPVYLTGADINV